MSTGAIEGSPLKLFELTDAVGGISLYVGEKDNRLTKVSIVK